MQLLVLVCYLWKGCCIWSWWNADSCPHMVHIQTCWWNFFMLNLCRYNNKSTYILSSTLEFQGIGYLHQSDMHFTEQSIQKPKKTTWSIRSGMSLLHKQWNVVQVVRIPKLNERAFHVSTPPPPPPPHHHHITWLVWAWEWKDNMK